MSSNQFSRSTVVLIVCAIVILFALSIIFGAAPTEKVSSDGGRAQADSFSLSAIGHAVLYDALINLSYTVDRNVGNLYSHSNTEDTVFFLEPAYGTTFVSNEIDPLEFRRALLVLPKWSGLKDSEKPKWLRSAVTKPIYAPQSVIRIVDNNATVKRINIQTQWAKNETGITPAFGEESRTIQVVVSKQIRPIIATKNGEILVGDYIDDENRLLIIADPDLLSNHGMYKGDNSILILSLIKSLHDWNSDIDYDDDMTDRIIFDETIHGYHREKDFSALTLLFRFPFIIVTVLFVLLVTLIVAAGSSRFGAPKIPEPTLDYGKAQLIDNSSKLFASAGHHVLVLRRYIWMTLRIVALILHAPRNLDERSLIRWLDQAGKARHVQNSLSLIMQPIMNISDNDKSSINILFECARSIYYWKGEILNATAKHSSRG